MACYHPISAWQKDDGQVVFVERGSIRRSLVLPCGQCVGCRLERSRQWAVRIMHESQLHDLNSFVTLTYDNEHLPADGSLNYRHFQLFMKKLRLLHKVRFYMCGEYGEKYGRPHFHACLFGYRPVDLVPHARLASGHTLYTSAELSGLWDAGFASVGELTFESAAYVARYVMKKVTGDMAESHYRKTDLSTGETWQISPEFCRMSLKPGIGAGWLEAYKADVYENDYVVVNGRKCKPPRYYDKLLSSFDPESSEYMEYLRYGKIMNTDFDSSPDRLRVRETVTRARLSFKSRSIE